jgi:DNA polymerase IV (DinB-like DNA polymerase)
MKIIAHLDMDAFFASIEEADSPIFKGKPIAVGSDPHSVAGFGTGRGVVSTANYKARKYGIHSALPISQAWQLSQKAKKDGEEEVIFLPVDMERYGVVSCGIYDIIKKYSKVVEPASIDEFYFDLTSSVSLRERSEATDVAIPEVEIASSPFAPRNDGNWQKAEKICLKIKDEIKQKYKITCSVGIAPNKLIAKIAAGMQKPDGFVIVRQGDEENFLEPLPVRELPGVGPKTGEILSKNGVEKIKDLKKFSYEDLYDMLGKYGIDLYYKAKGIDDSELVENREAKSIGEQTTFDNDTLDAVYIGEIFGKLCDNVFLRFKESGFKSFKTIAITVRFTGFETKTTAKTLRAPFDTSQGKHSGQAKKEFKIEALKLLLPYLDSRKNPDNKLIRLVGVKIENFTT